MPVKILLNRLVLSTAAAMLLLAAAAGCGSPQTTPTTPITQTTQTTQTNPTTPVTTSSMPALTVRLSSDVQPIFNSTCVVCHQGAGQAWLTLEQGKSYANLVGVKSTESPLMRVQAGAPDQSYLINKLEGTQVQAGGSGVQMPFNGTPLTAAQIELIRQWISRGALNN